MPLIAGLIAIFVFSVGDLFYRVMSPIEGVWSILVVTNGALLLATGLYLAYKKEGFFPKNFFGLPLVMMFLRIVNVVFAVMAFRELPVAQAYLLIFTYPILVAITEGIIKKKFKKKYLGVLLMGFAGIAIVFCTDKFVGNWGLLWAFLTAIGVSGTIVCSRQLASESFVKLSFSNASGCFIAALIGILLSKEGFVVDVDHQLRAWQWIGVASCSIIGPLCMTFAAQNISSVRYSLLCYLQIPVAVCLAWIILGESITLREGVGLVVIILSSVLAQILHKRSMNSVTHAPVEGGAVVAVPVKKD